MSISSEAIAQYSSNIYTYNKGYLYSKTDEYIADLEISNYSYNFARDFGTSVLNLDVVYSDDYTIEQDQIIVFIEGFDTSNETDKIPKFKGRICNIDDTETAENNILKLQVYDELILSQRSDFDGLFTATEYSASAVLIPVITEPIGQVLDTVYNTRVRIANDGTTTLASYIDNASGEMYIGEKHYITSKIYDSILELNEEFFIFYTGSITGTLTEDDIIRNKSNTFRATYKSAVTYNRGVRLNTRQEVIDGIMQITYDTSSVSENVIKILIPTTTGKPINDEILYKETGGNIDTSAFFTVKSFYELSAVKFANDFPIEIDNIAIGDEIHNGTVNYFRAAHANWSSLSPHKITVRRKGNITNEDIYNGYEMNFEKGILSLNEPINISQLDIVAKYKYINQGLSAEDVIRDIIIAEDDFRIENINDNFYSYNTYTNLASGTYSVITGTTNQININQTMSASKYLGLTSTVSIEDGYNLSYTHSYDVSIQGESSGVIYLKYNSASALSFNLTENQNITQTFTLSASSVNLYVYASGCKANTTIKLSNPSLRVNPCVYTALSKDNLYLTIGQEKKTVSASAMTLSVTGLLDVLPTYTYLSTDLDVSDTNIHVIDSTAFESQGYVKINNEVIHYTSNSANILTGLTRGIETTNVVDHSIGTRAYAVMSASRCWYLEFNNIIPKTKTTNATYMVSGATTPTEINGEYAFYGWFRQNYETKLYKYYKHKTEDFYICYDGLLGSWGIYDGFAIILNPTTGYSALTSPRFLLVTQNEYINGEYEPLTGEGNVVIETYKETFASDYNVNGLNIMSAGSFTIVGSTFKEGFYREGIVVTNTVASSVTLTTNTNYLFNSLQATGIEFPYVLIDYKTYDKKLDALNELKSAIAPNYVIRAVVRKIDSNYRTFIKGSYLTQKTTKDYDALGVLSINETISNENYNRIKMFGKLDKPINIMYDKNTKVYTYDNLDSVYIKGVGYQYLRQDGDRYIYENINSNNIPGNNNLSWTDVNFSIRGIMYITFNDNTNTEFVLSLNEYRRPNAMVPYLPFENNKFYMIDIDNYTLGYKVNNVWHSDANFKHNSIGTKYNIYNIKYKSGSTDEFRIDDILSGATVEFVGHYDDNNLTNDAVLFVQHRIGDSLFSNGTTLTNDRGTSGTTTIIGTQINYNQIVFWGTTNSLSIKTFSQKDTGIESSIAATIGNSFNEPAKYNVYIDGKLQNNTITYEEKVVELGSGEEYKRRDLWQDLGLTHKIYRSYKRRMNAFNIYVAENESDAIRIEGSSDRIRAGQISFERNTGDKIDVLLVVKSKQDPMYRANPTKHFPSDNHSIEYALTDGNYIFYEPGSNTLSEVIRNATHIRYFAISGDIDYYLSRNRIYIKREDLLKIANDPRGVGVRVDGNFVIGIDSSFTDDSTVPAIERLRHMGVGISGKQQQIGFASRNPIDELPLYVVDLGSSKSLSYVDIQAGHFYKPDDDIKYPVKFAITLKYCNKNIDFELLTEDDFEEINDKFNEVSMDTGDIHTFTSDDFGERFKTRYLKVFIKCDENPLEFGKESDNKNDLVDYYGGAISGMAIYADDILISEQGVVADVINLYKDTKVYENITTQELLDKIALIRLIEFQKNNNLLSTNLIYGPQYEIGNTLYIPQRSKNYFIEEINCSNGDTTLKLANFS